MSLPLVFRVAAQAELMRDAAWYEEQRAGLGEDFIHEIERILAVVSEQPNRDPRVLGDIREAPVRRFPYAIYYRAKASHVVVLAVFNCSRDPSIWKGRS